jgi:hypothetical protein
LGEGIVRLAASGWNAKLREISQLIDSRWSLKGDKLEGQARDIGGKQELKVCEGR